MFQSVVWQMLPSSDQDSETVAADKNGFIGLLAGLQQAVPDLQWRIDEVLLTGQ